MNKFSFLGVLAALGLCLEFAAVSVAQNATGPAWANGTKHNSAFFVAITMPDASKTDFYYHYLEYVKSYKDPNKPPFKIYKLTPVKDKDGTFDCQITNLWAKPPEGPARQVPLIPALVIGKVDTDGKFAKSFDAQSMDMRGSQRPTKYTINNFDATKGVYVYQSGTPDALPTTPTTNPTVAPAPPALDEEEQTLKIRIDALFARMPPKVPEVVTAKSKYETTLKESPDPRKKNLQTQLTELQALYNEKVATFGPEATAAIYGNENQKKATESATKDYDSKFQTATTWDELKTARQQLNSTADNLLKAASNFDGNLKPQNIPGGNSSVRGGLGNRTAQQIIDESNKQSSDADKPSSGYGPPSPETPAPAADRYRDMISGLKVGAFATILGLILLPGAPVVIGLLALGGFLLGWGMSYIKEL